MVGEILSLWIWFMVGRIRGNWQIEMMGNGSISLAQIDSIPHRTEARGKPEMPSNRLPIVSFLVDCVISYTPFYLIAAAMVLVTFTADCAV